MTKIFLTSSAVVLMTMFANETWALDTENELRPDVYAIEMQDDKIVRLNKKTGEMSVCNFNEDGLVCQLATEEASKEGDKITDLENRIKELESLIKSKNNTLLKSKEESKLDAEMERAIDYSSKVMRRFFNVMKDLKKDLEKDFN